MELAIFPLLTSILFCFLQFFNITLSTILVLLSIRLFVHLRKFFEKPERYAFILIITHVIITLLGFFITGIEEASLPSNENILSQLLISLLLVMNGTFQFIITKATLRKCECGG